MYIQIGKKYRFSNSNQLVPTLRGKEFSPIRFTDKGYTVIKVWDVEGNIIPTPKGDYYWVAVPPNSDHWSNILFYIQGKSSLEFKFI